MAQTALITLTTAGVDSGPFNLYSNIDGYITPFESGIDRASMMSGFTSYTVPDFTTIVRVQSMGVQCSNFIDISLELTTTTSTTTSAPPSTTTTSTSSSTTTTTTTLLLCYNYINNSGVGINATWLDCVTGDPQGPAVIGNGDSICARTGTVSGGVFTQGDACSG